MSVPRGKVAFTVIGLASARRGRRRPIRRPRHSVRTAGSRPLSLNALVLALNASGACIASMAVMPLRDVARLVRAPRLRRAWRALTAVILCCIGLLLATMVADAWKPLDAGDLAGALIHVLGPSFVLIVASLSRSTARDMLRVAALEEAAFADPLTGLANRRRFDERLVEEVRRARAGGLPLSLVMLDVDHFKAINDRHGHAAGDLVLKRIATVLAGRAGAADTACRIGGEEFSVIVPGQEPGFAAAGAERLRRAIAAAGVPLDDGGEIGATVSLGLAALRPGESADALFRRADAALYAAKRAGRDRVSPAA